MTNPAALAPTLAETHDPARPPSPPARAASPTLSSTVRSTVLPRSSGAASPVESAPRFESIRVLGRGGLGEVTLAHDRDIDRPVAVKRMRTDVMVDRGLDLFADEVRTVGQLEHPNIAPIHDVGLDAQGHYFVMRYIDGETLETIIARLAAGDPAYHARFTFAYRVQVFLGVLNAIHYAHARGVLHRDLKPANIMVGRFGEVVVMDWGIATRFRPPATATAADPFASTAPTDRDASTKRRRGSALIGTPAYMSPEQALGYGDELDERSDTYSLAVLCYELLALRHYLPAQPTVAAMIDAIVAGVHQPAPHVASPHQPPVPAELGWFLAKGMATGPEQRYQTVDEMIAALQRVIAGGFRVQCYVTLMKRAGAAAMRIVDKRPRAALVTAVAGLGAAAVGLVELVARLAG